MKTVVDRKMPRVEHGLQAAITGSITGFVFSFTISAISPTLGSLGSYLIVSFNLLAILLMLRQFEKMNYWSLYYSLGYLLGIAFFGHFFMEVWELALYLVVTSLYVFRKILRKVK